METAACSEVIGRERELADVESFLHAEEGGPRTLLLTGPAGIGKTTLWERSRDIGRARGLRVLETRPAAAEAALAFAGLADLLSPVADDVLGDLAAPQRHALEVALLRKEAGRVPAAPRAVYSGTLGALRALSARETVVVAVDDVQWLDDASAQALAFAARRLASEPVRFVLARRAEAPSVLEAAFTSDESIRLELGPLSFGAWRELVMRRTSSTFNRRIVRQVYDASGGNPLFALEMCRRLAQRGVPDVGEELPLPELVEDAVAERVAALPPRLRRLLLALALGGSPALAEVKALAGEATLRDGVDAGVVVLEGERVRSAHPLFAAAARASSTARERAAVHRALAAAAHDPELAVRHLALAAEGADERLAVRLDRASGHAAARGSPGDAAELAAHAYRLTPPESPRQSELLLELAQRLLVVGEHPRAQALVRSALERLTPGAQRARALLILAESDPEGDVAPVGAYLQAALAESKGSPEVHALATARWSRHLLVGPVAGIVDAERAAGEAVPAARRAGPSVEREVLHALALARLLRGRPIEDLVERFDALSADAFNLHRGAVRLAAERLACRGLVTDARESLRQLHATAEERGEALSAIWLVHQRCELELRAGDWQAAADLLDEWEQSPDRLLIDSPGLDRCRALHAAGVGRTVEAEALAVRALEACEARGLRWNILEALRARGVAALLAREPALAVASLGEVWAHCEREGIDEPGEFPVAPDLVEALLELGRVTEATAVAFRLRKLAEAQKHPWGLATAERCGALLALVERRDAAQVARLVDAASSLEELGLRFDAARALLAGGRAARALRRWGDARSLLGRAAASFDAIGSEGWADATRADLDRLPGRRPSPTGSLTASEQRVAALAASGLANREIAERLHVSVNTVERHLVHTYAKLGVRSRTQLVGRLAAR